MKLKHMVSREMSLFFKRPRWLIVPCILTLCMGVVTWLSCDGIGFVWRITRHPTFAPPLVLMFFIWVTVYALFGVIISYSMLCGIKCSLSLCAVVSYFAALFWCPIMLSAGAGICAVCTLILSCVYLFRVVRVIYRYSILTSISAAVIAAFEIYMICFSVSCAVLN